jgi:hypothetical protein
VDAGAREADEDAELGRGPLRVGCAAVAAEIVIGLLLDRRELCARDGRPEVSGRSIDGGAWVEVGWRERERERETNLGSRLGIDLPHGLGSHGWQKPWGCRVLTRIGEGAAGVLGVGSWPDLWLFRGPRDTGGAKPRTEGFRLVSVVCVRRK